MTEHRLIILGAGGHARVVLDSLRALRVTVVGLLDHDPARHGHTLDDAPILGDDTLLGTNALANVTHAIAAIGDNAARRAALDAARAAGITPFSVIDPTASVSPRATIAAGGYVARLAAINAGAVIAENAIINTRAVVEHDASIGTDAHIAPAAVVLGAASVGRGCLIGAGSVILPGRSVGDHATIGAGAVVTRDVPPRAIAYGNPARPR